jgi:hypothetical protein
MYLVFRRGKIGIDQGRASQALPFSFAPPSLAMLSPFDSLT